MPVVLTEKAVLLPPGSDSKFEEVARNSSQLGEHFGFDVVGAIAGTCRLDMPTDCDEFAQRAVADAAPKERVRLRQVVFQVDAEVRLGEYDFKRKGFPVRVSGLFCEFGIYADHYCLSARMPAQSSLLFDVDFALAYDPFWERFGIEFFVPVDTARARDVAQLREADPVGPLISNDIGRQRFGRAAVLIRPTGTFQRVKKSTYNDLLFAGIEVVAVRVQFDVPEVESDVDAGTLTTAGTWTLFEKVF